MLKTGRFRPICAFALQYRANGALDHSNGWTLHKGSTMQRRHALFGLVTVVAACVSSAASARSLDDIISAGTIRVGVNPSFATAMLNDNNQLAGFDVDLSNKLAQMLGVKAEFVTLDSQARIPSLTTGLVDIVLGGMTRTPDRAKLIDFTVPIMTETLGALTLKGNPHRKLADLNSPDVTLAEIRGTTPVPWIQQHLPRAKLLLLDNHPDVLRAVADGRATAVVDDLASIGAIARTIDAQWSPIADHADEVDWDCIGVAKADPTLRRWLNVALFSLQSSSFVEDTYHKWFGFNMAAPIPAQPYF
jgi:polar amino acid transport system substrate-binding protein